MHQDCILPFVSADIAGRKDQAIDAMRKLAHDSESDESHKNSAGIVLDQLTSISM
jgi:Flp pilus assembly protein TadD